VVKLQLVMSVVGLVVWIYCLVDVAQTREAEIRHLNKVAWLLIVFFFSVLGVIGWFVFGRPQKGGARRASAYEPTAPEFPEYDRPGRAAAADPEKDEEFLRQVRARAEEQRKRYEERKKREQDGGAAQ
jgi:hypothetical protein